MNSCKSCKWAEKEGLCYRCQDGQVTQICENGVCEKYEKDDHSYRYIGGALIIIGALLVLLADLTMIGAGCGIAGYILIELNQ